MFLLLVMALWVATTGVCRGQELGGNLDVNLSWLPTGGFSFRSQLYTDLDLGDLDVWTKIKFDEDGLERSSVGLRWYRRPMRLAGEAEFTENALRKGKIEFRYWKDPWNLKLKGTLAQDDSPFLEFSGTYEGENGIEAKWALALDPSLSPRELNAGLTLPLGEGSNLHLSVKGKPREEPLYGLLWKGMTAWGELRLSFQNFLPHSAELYREWTEGKWVHELDLLMDVPETTLELVQRSTFYLTDKNGYGFSIKAQQAAKFELKRVDFFLFGSGWKFKLKGIEREIHMTAQEEISPDLMVGGEFHLYPEEWEGVIWIWDQLWAGLECEVGGELANGVLEELYLEIYAEF